MNKTADNTYTTKIEPDDAADAGECEPTEQGTLKDLINAFKDKTHFCIGASTPSGWWFIGDKNEFYRDYDKLVSQHSSFKAKPILERKVLKIYRRIVGGYGVIVEGKEPGKYWYEEEYLNDADND